MQINFPFIDSLLTRFGYSKQAQKAYFNTRVPYMINKGRVYINTDVPYNVYNSIPQINITVDKLAAMFSNGVFKFQVIATGKIEDLPPDWSKLMENPNMFQGQNDFMKQWYRQLLIYGNQYVKKNQASKLSVPKSLINVSSAYITPVMTGKMFDQVKMKEVISGYEYNEEGRIKTFDTDEVLWSKIGDLDNPIIGCSPLLSLKFPISNTELAYKYLNCISGEKGNIGILSQIPVKDSMGQLPADPEAKKELEKQYREQNGVDDDQKKIMITDAPISWTPMSYPTAQLQLREQIADNFDVILFKYGVNRNLFNSSTYENLRHGLVATHNDTVQPAADGFCQSLGTFIGVPEGKRLILDYSHLPYLKPDKLSEAQTFASVSAALASLVSGGIINAAQANQILANQFGMKI